MPLLAARFTKERVHTSCRLLQQVRSRKKMFRFSGEKKKNGFPSSDGFEKWISVLRRIKKKNGFPSSDGRVSPM